MDGDDAYSTGRRNRDLGFDFDGGEAAPAEGGVDDDDDSPESVYSDY